MAQHTSQAKNAQTKISDEGKALRAEFLAARTSRAKNTRWIGNWTRPFRYSRGDLKITNISAVKFKFEISALTGANSGEISGVAQIKGDKAFFDDNQAIAKDADKYNCQMLFIDNGKSIEIKETAGCSNYAGAGVTFGGEYLPGKPALTPQNFVELEVFPNLTLDRKFKSLVGHEYESFLNSFHLVNEGADLDNLNAKVFAACVRGICPFMGGIIMFDATGRIWAAVLNDDGKTLSVHYYASDADWTDKLPETIKKWKDDLDSKMPVIFKSKQK